MILLWIAVGVGVASYVMAVQAQKKAEKAARAMAGVLVNKESNIEPIPVVYGERRLGGVRVFMSSKNVSGGDPNEFLYVVLTLCEGRVESITDIELDGNPISDAKYNGLVTSQIRTGGDGQAYVSFLNEADADWDSTHKLSGVAYVALKLKWNTKAFQGVPEITALVKGRRVYDPRQDSTSSAYDASVGVNTQRLGNNNTWTWSLNPALCIRDYLSNTRFGKGLPSSAIDIDSIGSAATDCDELVTPYVDAVGTIPVFQCHAVLQTDKSIFDNIETLLMGCRGFLPFNQGLYSLRIDKARNSSFEFNIDNMTSALQIKGVSKEDKYNRVVTKFPNNIVNYEPDEISWPNPNGSTYEQAQHALFQTEDNGTDLLLRVDLEAVTSPYVARELAKVILFRSRYAKRVQFKATSEALNVSVADTVTVVHPTLSSNLTPKLYQVEELSLNYDGTVTVGLVEYNAGIYTYDQPPIQDAFNVPNLPNPFAVAQVTNLTGAASTFLGSDGTVIPRITISWDAAPDSFVEAYDVEFKKTSEGNDAYRSIRVTTLQTELTDVEIGVSYNVSVFSVNAMGVRSDAVSITTAGAGDTTAPGVPTSPTATAAFKSISLSFNTPVDTDLSHVNVYRGVSGGQYTLMANVSCRPRNINGTWTASACEFVNGGLNSNTLYFYKFSSVDFSGNESALSSQVSATTLVDPVDGDTGPRNATGYVYYALSSTNTPSTPSASGAYNFTTGVFSGLTQYWSRNPPSINGSDKSYWVSMFSVQEATFGVGATQSKQFATPVPSFVFNGIVTFVNLNTELADANSSEITTINGGLIKTGLVEANRLRIDNVGIDTVTAGGQTSLIIGSQGIKNGNIEDGAVTNVKITGAIQSAAYSSGTAGWKIDKAGDAEFNDAVFRGTLTAASGTLGDVTLPTGGDIRSGQTAFNTGTGFFLGNVGGTPKFSIGNPNGANMRWTGSQLIIEGATRTVTAGDQVLAVSIKGGQTNIATYVKVAEIAIGVDGAIRTKATIAGGNSSTTAYGQFRKNGSSSAYKSFSKSNTGYTEFVDTSENINPGDTIELWLKSNVNGRIAFWGSFGVYASEGAAAAVTLEV